LALVIAVTPSCSLIVPSVNDLAGGRGNADAGAVQGLRDLSTLHCADMSPQPRFCDDFEHAGPSTGWDGASLSAGGSVTIDSTDSRSPTRSLLCTTPSSTTDTPIANVFRFFPDVMSDIWIRFDWKIASRPVTGRFVFALLRLGRTPDSLPLSFQFDIGPDDPIVLEEADHRTSANGDFYPHALGAGAVQFGVWQYVQVHLTLATSPRVSITIDGNTVVDDGLAAPNPAPSPGALSAGIFYAVPGDAHTIHFDNITLDY
jgi:hypothetical protein